MTERELDQKIEEAAAGFERRVEAAADHLDRAVNQAWNGSRLFRRAARGASLAAEGSLFLFAWHLAGRGHRTGAAWCAGLGAVSLAAHVLIGLCVRKE